MDIFSLWIFNVDFVLVKLCTYLCCFYIMCVFVCISQLQSTLPGGRMAGDLDFSNSETGCAVLFHVGRDNGHYFWYIFCQSLYMDQCSLDGLYILYMSECIMQMFDH